MFAAYAVRADADAPLNALAVGEMEGPSPPTGWVRVRMKAAAVNHHDVWSHRGEVTGHAVITAPQFARYDATDITQWSLWPVRYPGTSATHVWVLPANLV